MIEEVIAVILRRTAGLLLALGMVFVFVSCGESKSDDSSMTERLLGSYMDSLCSYDLSGMNKCSLAGLEPYGDSKQAVKACKAIANRIRWENTGMIISGSSATAQVTITAPAGMQEICTAALEDTFKSIDKDASADVYELLVSAVRKRAAKADVTEISTEVSMTKIDNKWYIVKSSDVSRIVSDIRTPVAAAFATLDR